jgi:tetratricopeptide (TPR) repeat protein
MQSRRLPSSPVVRAALVASLIMLTVAAPPVAGVAAAADLNAARAAYEEGKKHYALNDFAAALEAFKRAYWHSEQPVFLFNIAQCHRQLGNLPEAAKFYRSYLRQAPTAANRGEVEKTVARIEATLAQQQATVSAPPHTTVPPPSSSAKALDPTAKAPAAAPTATTTAAQGQPAALAVTAPPPRPERRRTRPWVWALVGLGAAAVVGVSVGVGVAYGRPTQSTFTPIEVP